MPVYLIDRTANPTRRPTVVLGRNPSSALNRGLLLWYAATGGGTSNFTDRSVYRRAATLTDPPTAYRAHPVMGYGPTFSTDRIEYADAPEYDTGGELTVFACVQCNGGASQMAAVSRGGSGMDASGGWYLGVGATQATDFGFRVRNSGGVFGADSGTGFTTAEPVFLTGVLRAHTVAELYVNGTMTATATQAGTHGALANPIRIGAFNLNVQPWLGTIWDVRVWNRALSEGEVVNLFRQPWELYQPVSRRVFVNVQAGKSLTLRGNATSQAMRPFLSR